MYQYEIKPNLQTILKKLYKKDRVQYQALMNKIQEIAHSGNIDHYKNLKYALSEFKRVHVMGSFVLIFKYDRRTNLISFEDYDHHDVIYAGR